MRGRRRVQPRRTVFIAGEGPSERAFVIFLQRLCDESDLYVHLDAKPQDGGGAVNVIEQAGRWLEKNPPKREYKARLVLLDRDRVVEDPQEGDKARKAARRYGLDIIFQDPNLEGLLVRLHQRQEQRKIRASESESELRRMWPAYQKPPTAEQLRQRFTLDDVRRAAVHDEYLRKLLEVIGL